MDSIFYLSWVWFNEIRHPRWNVSFVLVYKRLTIILNDCFGKGV